MTAQELRIGNLVYLDDTIITITLKDLIAISQSEDWAKLYQPIPLTEDILLKCAFKKSYTKPRNCYVYKKNKAYIEICIYKNGRIDIYITKTVIEAPQFRQMYIKELFIHDLQNKIYSITGEELIVNL